ncbi:MAG: hypothetical protein ACRESF_12015 [Pseudomonas sp.]
MGRSQSQAISDQSKANSAQDQTNAQTALTGTNTALKNYSDNLNNFMKFGRQTYGSNGEFMKDANTIATTGAAAGSKSIQGNAALHAMQTGENTGGYAGAEAESQRQADRDLTGTLATADSTRLQNLTNINQQGVQMSALPAQVQSSLYGTSLGGGNTAMGTAASASAAAPGFLDVFGSDLAQGAGAAIGAYA